MNSSVWRKDNEEYDCFGVHSIRQSGIQEGFNAVMSAYDYDLFLLIQAPPCSFFVHCYSEQELGIGERQIHWNQKIFLCLGMWLRTWELVQSFILCPVQS